MIIAKATTYEFDLDEIKKMIAKELNASVNSISVKYIIQEIGADCMDRYPGIQTVTGVKVTVKSL